MAAPTPSHGRWHFLIAPALAVINRLRYPHKFLLISLLFALPLTLVMYMLITEMNDRIAFTQKELDGSKYLRPLRKVYEHVSQSRALAREFTAGRVALRPELIRKQTEIDEDFAALQALDQELGAILKSTAKYEALRENWRFLKEKLLQLDPVNCDELHAQLLSDTRALASHVGDTSNLILDPDLDTYYLMDSVLLKLPAGQELIVQLRSYARQTLAPGGTLSAEQRSEFVRLVGLLRSNAEESRTGMQTAFKNNPSGTLAPSLEDPLRRFSTETETLLRVTDTNVLGPKTVTATPDDYDRLARTALDANFGLWDRTVNDLDSLLRVRRDGVITRKTLVIIATIAALLLVAYLWVAFYIGVMRTVSRLREASERMLGGSIDHVVTLETRDELGHVATSFNKIAVRMREEWRQAREESARAQAAETQAQQQAATVELLQAVSAGANEAATPEAALRIGIERVCVCTRWLGGHAFLPDKDDPDRFVPSDVWYAGNVDAFARFCKAIDGSHATPGVGLVGRVLASEQPDWVLDITKEAGFRAAVSELKAKAAFAFPVKSDGKVVAVLEFFSQTASVPESSLLDSMTNIDAQLGRVFDRQRSEAELRQAHALAEDANKAKSVFLATMSHEIRTPLNAVLGMASLLQDTDLSEQQQEFARVIRTSGEALLGVINDILDFSKIEAGHLEIEREAFDLRACVEDATDVIAVRGSEKGLELASHLASSVPSWIEGDVTRVRQILINLLSNAVKFTERGEVVVSVDAVPLEDGRHEITFAVRDSGIGIPPDRMSRLFRSFSQVDASTTRKYGGTGLGLAISKRLAELMGGRMWATSEVGRGSTFSFAIVAQATAAPAAPKETATDLGILTGKRFLVVDDNETNRRIVSLVVQGWGCTTQDTGSPLEALRWLDEGAEFDLALLDIAMPEMDGIALASAIRKKEGQVARMPLVAFTSLTRREAMGDRREFDGFVTKPLKPAALLEVLLALLSGREMQRGERRTKSEFDATLGKRFPLRILVAEDVPVNQQMMRVMLGRMAYDADFADNGIEVLRAIERREYDLIFMDMQMPEMDGLECSRAVRSQKRERQLAIVALTANVSTEDAQRCKAAGMDDFLTKPIKPLELRRCLEEWGGRLSPRSPAVHDASPARQEPLPPEHPHREGEAPAEPPLLDEVTLADLRDLNEGEPGMLESFVEGFRQATVEHLPLLREAVAAGNGEQLRQLAHRLKGTAANVAAGGVADCCGVLEKAGKAGELSDAPRVIEELESRFHRTITKFAEMGVGKP